MISECSARYLVKLPPHHLKENVHTPEHHVGKKTKAAIWKNPSGRPLVAERGTELLCAPVSCLTAGAPPQGRELLN